MPCFHLLHPREGGKMLETAATVVTIIENSQKALADITATHDFLLIHN